MSRGGFRGGGGRGGMTHARFLTKILALKYRLCDTQVVDLAEEEGVEEVSSKGIWGLPNPS